MEQNNLIEEIKRKKELSGLTNSIVSNILDNYLKKHSIILKNLKSKELKIIIKDIRVELRKLSGRFQKSFKKIKLEENNIGNILKTHSSTAERLDFYPKLKNIISKLKVHSILDIGCGLNPIALANKKIYYYASDINEEYLQLIKKFFERNHIKGDVFVFDVKVFEQTMHFSAWNTLSIQKSKQNIQGLFDIRNSSMILPKADLCLLFKLLDIIEIKSHKIAKALIEKLECKYILISFATKTLSGKQMKYPKRKWLEFLLEDLNYKYKIFNSNNEIFYLVKKY